MEIKLKRCIFISSSQRDTESQGCFKNKWMLNNVFDVLYLNLYGYLHYSFFPGLGTNPIDMEMGCSVSWQSWGERERERKRERERSQVCSYSKCAENRFLESFGFMVLVIGDYTNHLELNNELLFSINKKKSPSCWTHSPHSREVNQEQIKSILWLEDNDAKILDF